ncbi:hypothetical protein HNP65_001519 [Thermosipho japonicus]|uniref:ATPase n=1 Tax=Thermosipho japonicus TaxID=90323 RepID=A0A841GH84_9BACT|nr:ATP-binding protein [Thermosipho japonicus]MBB6063056.1 hypothetical protein [Thermosipho japonicus]
MVSSEILKEIIIENENFISKLDYIFPRNINLPDLKYLKKAVILYGVRRSGKSYILLDIYKKNSNNALYIDFEDERLNDLQPEDLEKIKEAFFELKPNCLNNDKVIFLFDEIQNVPSWEKYVRRLIERNNITVFCAGSSSKITPYEIHTSLRGRSWSIEILPFSFKEFVSLKTNNLDPSQLVYGENKIIIKKLFIDYLKFGGLPELSFLENEFDKKKILKEYINSMYFRDIVERYQIKNIQLLDALWDKLFSSFSTRFSLHSFYKHYKELIPFSKDSLYAYYKYFLNSMLVYEVRKFSESSYKRVRNPVKIYLVDHGLAKKVTSEDYGRILENIVYIELKRKGFEIFYFYEKSECDFIAKKDNLLVAYQVTWELNEKNKSREIKGILSAAKYLNIDNLNVLTYEQEDTLEIDGKKIKVLPIWKWLLS